jgi:hypothetical protein
MSVVVVQPADKIGYDSLGAPGQKILFSKAITAVEDFDGRMACFWARLQKREIMGDVRT